MLEIDAAYGRTMAAGDAVTEKELENAFKEYETIIKC